jgi:hypothetical protein
MSTLHNKFLILEFFEEKKLYLKKSIYITIILGVL